MSENNMKHRSSVYDSMVKSPNRAMLRATGMTDDSFKSLLLGLSQLGLRTRHVISTCTVLVKLPKRVSEMWVLGQFNLVQLPLQMVLPWGHQGCVSH